VVTDVLPAALQGTTWTCSASPGSSCTASGAGGIGDTVSALVGGNLNYTLTGTIDPTATVSIANTATVTVGPGASDPAVADNSATDVDALPLAFPVDGELLDGSDRLLDLAALPGPVADEDVFRVFQERHSSYEALVDGVSGDLGTGAGPFLERLGSDAATVIQESSPAGVGGSRSLRWLNGLGHAVVDELVRVRSAGCTTTCLASDAYRLRFRETTAFIPRFNNSGTQRTVLLLQNTEDQTVDLDVRFWGASGEPLGGVLSAVPPHGTFVINTATVVPDAAGSISVGHTGRYGRLAGKAVALEPATGFTFDTALEPVRR
jgi:hypothetical protein